MRLELWKRPNDWRATVHSRLGESYGYSTWRVVAAWRAFTMYLSVRSSASRKA